MHINTDGMASLVWFWGGAGGASFVITAHLEMDMNSLASASAFLALQGDSGEQTTVTNWQTNLR